MVNITKKFYMTTAIPYVNANPHLGHALEFVQADVIKRYHEGLGESTFLVTGADENSLKNVEAAEEKGLTTKELCDINAEKFRQMALKIGLSFDTFMRSSSKEEHWKGVHKLWLRCKESGDIYKKKYKGLYCVGCEAFYKEDELVGGMCPEHKRKLEEVEEENYFFALSKYQKKLEELIEKGELKIDPESRKNEVLAFIRRGLEDFSISRSVKRAKGWGIPVPGDDSQIIYVWFDALGCYLTGVGYGTDEGLFKKWWPADLHIIGKGILRFHAVYWPAILLSAKIELPKAIMVHGYITVEGQKMSKTLENVLDPLDLIERYGSDQLRYYLSKEIPTFEDGDFSEARLVEKINSELVANLGNLVNRTLIFIKNNFDGKLPEGLEKNLENDDKEYLSEQKGRYKKIKELLAALRTKDAIDEIMAVSHAANKYFQENTPWKLVKTNKERAAVVLFVLVNTVKDVGILTGPYLPKTSELIFKQLNIEKKKWDDLGELSVGKKPIGEPNILFKKVEKKELASTSIEKKAPEVKFSDLDLEVGEIASVEKHHDAEKLFVERIRLGDGERQIVSGLAPYYFPEELVGKKVIIVKNLKPAKLRGVESNGMLLAAEGNGIVEVIFCPSNKVGDKVHLEGQQNKPRSEITIDDFAKVKITVQDSKVIAEGKHVFAGDNLIRTTRVEEGNVG